VLETAAVVASRYNMRLRSAGRIFARMAQRRVGRRLQGGRFNDEIVPFTTSKMVRLHRTPSEITYQQ